MFLRFWNKNSHMANHLYCNIYGICTAIILFMLLHEFFQLLFLQLLMRLYFLTASTTIFIIWWSFQDIPFHRASYSCLDPFNSTGTSLRPCCVTGMIKATFAILNMFWNLSTIFSNCMSQKKLGAIAFILNVFRNATAFSLNYNHFFLFLLTQNKRIK